MEVFSNMTATEKDPVCGMDVDTANAAGQTDYEGQTYYFCSQPCKRQFDENPQRFTQESGRHAGGGI
jgi:Cu+-exporting ATPase